MCLLQDELGNEICGTSFAKLNLVQVILDTKDFLLNILVLTGQHVDECWINKKSRRFDTILSELTLVLSKRLIWFFWFWKTQIELFAYSSRDSPQAISFSIVFWISFGFRNRNRDFFILGIWLAIIQVFWLAINRLFWLANEWRAVWLGYSGRISGIKFGRKSRALS